jgi:hypothetical protein
MNHETHETHEKKTKAKNSSFCLCLFFVCFVCFVVHFFLTSNVPSSPSSFLKSPSANHAFALASSFK